MKTIKTLALMLAMLFGSGCTNLKEKPSDFVMLSEVDATIIQDVRYSTKENFLGRPAVGYKTTKIACTKKAAESLKQAHDYFKSQGYNLVVYDAYRPQRAVDDFRGWGNDLNDLGNKASYYPTLEKKDLFKLGYIAGEKSSHTRGSTFDLTLIKMGTKLKPIVISKRKLSQGDEIPYLDDNTVDMGSSFDLFHEISHHDSKLTKPEHNATRNLLREGMKRFGFKEYKEEWWHYTLENEPYPDTYFDFVIEE